MSSSAQKRVVIITGASRGLGRAIALRFGCAGDRVVVNYQKNARAAESVVQEIARQNGEAVPFKADVRIANEVDAMVEEAKKRWGSINVLVNNAGITRDGLMLRMSEQDWDDVLAVNLKGAFLALRSAARAMSEQRDGHIINIASIAGAQGREGQANYAAAKAGLIGLTKASAKELGSSNIKVNAVMPGYLRTDMGDKVSNEIIDRVLRKNALGGTADAGEVAEFVYRLSLMNNVSGQVFNLDSRVV